MRVSVGSLLLILGYFTVDKVHPGMTKRDINKSLFLFASIGSCIFLHTCTFYFRKTCKCAVKCFCNLGYKWLPQNILGTNKSLNLFALLPFAILGPTSARNYLFQRFPRTENKLSALVPYHVVSVLGPSFQVFQKIKSKN